MSTFTEAQKTVIHDLLSEKSLWQIYWKSRSIPFSRMNSGCGYVAGLIAFLLACNSPTVGSIADQLYSLASLAFNSCIALLGFLIAGFSFFATVFDKALFSRMAEIKHDKSGLSYLKYNFFLFMRVFVEYLAFSGITFGCVAMLERKSGGRSFLVEVAHFSDTLAPRLAGFPPHFLLASLVFGVFIGTFAYLLMELNSFVFNVYHVVMTSIRWAVEEEYMRDNKAATHSEKPPEPHDPNIPKPTPDNRQ